MRCGLFVDGAGEPVAESHRISRFLRRCSLCDERLGQRWPSSTALSGRHDAPRACACSVKEPVGTKMKQSQLIERLLRIRARKLTLIAMDEISELIEEIRTTGVQADIAEMPREVRAARS